MCEKSREKFYSVKCGAKSDGPNETNGEKKEVNFIYGTNNANVSSRYDWMHLLFFSSL